MNHSYDDILHLPHPVSAHHTPMSISDRAAQFSPFAALTGYEAAVAETARLTDQKISLDESQKLLIGETICAAAESGCTITITYFEPDSKKDGGSYQVQTGTIRRIDTAEHLLIFSGGARIYIDEIVSAALN